MNTLGRILTIALPVILFQRIAFPQNTTCAALGSPNTTVSLSDVEPYRLPSTNDLNVSPACRADADSKINEWRNSDIADFQRLANRLCSALDGWVERVPGTCQAGGPPPICKVDHWKRVDPRTSFEQFRDEQLKIAAARREQLKRAACKCKATELIRKDQEMMGVTAAHQGDAPTSATYYGSYTVPCYNGTCPIGTSCSAGVCKAPSHLQKEVEDMALNEAKSQAKGALEKQALKMLSTTLLSVSGTFGGVIVLKTLENALDPPSMSTDRDLYKNQMSYVTDDLAGLNRLYNELDDSEKGKPARAQSMIREEIRQTKARFTDHIQTLNIAYAAVVRDRQLHADECYEVFEYQQQKINQAFADYMSAP